MLYNCITATQSYMLQFVHYATTFSCNFLYNLQHNFAVLAVKLHGVFDRKQGSHRIQGDIDQLLSSAGQWQVEINSGKCEVMYSGRYLIRVDRYNEGPWVGGGN